MKKLLVPLLALIVVLALQLTGVLAPHVALADTSVHLTSSGTLTVAANFTLTISVSGNGSVTPGSGNYTYTQGETVHLTYTQGENVTLRANADYGYRFVNWAGDKSTIDDPTSRDTFITMNADYSIVAVFALDAPRAAVPVVAGVGARAAIPPSPACSTPTGGCSRTWRRPART